MKPVRWLPVTYVLLFGVIGYALYETYPGRGPGRVRYSDSCLVETQRERADRLQSSAAVSSCAYEHGSVAVPACGEPWDWFGTRCRRSYSLLEYSVAPDGRCRECFKFWTWE